MSDLTIHSTTTLNNGVRIPVFGLGVFRTDRGSETRDAVYHALKVGYRHIDTAKFYSNEHDVGEAVRKSGLHRDEIFITTKLWNSDHGYDKAIRACNESLKQLGLPYVDLYLIHYPVRNLRKESWRALETLYDEGKCRAIGVSNYTISHLEDVLASCNITPAVNQVEFHPFLFQKELMEFCQKHRIALEAYSPLTKGRRINDPKLIPIAGKYSKTTAQILIRWALQHHLIVIPKSAKLHRIEENANVFDFNISNEDMTQLDAMNENYRVAWDPTHEP